MRVYNLTDIETPALKARGWVGLPIIVGQHVVNPGEELEVGDTAMNRRDLQSFTPDGALSVGVRPPEYLVAKANQASRARLAQAEQVAKAKKMEK